MSGMILEPLTAYIRFFLPSPKQIQEWTEILKRFFKTLATLCHKSGPCMIGHIKGLALLRSDDYVRVSVIDPSLPAQVETNASGDLAELTITLNMLVYGLSRKSLEGIVKEAAAKPGTVWSGRVTVEIVSATTQDYHPSHHHSC